MSVVQGGHEYCTSLGKGLNVFISEYDLLCSPPQIMARNEFCRAITLIGQTWNQLDQCLPPREEILMLLTEVIRELQPRSSAELGELGDLLLHVRPDLIPVQRSG